MKAETDLFKISDEFHKELVTGWLMGSSSDSANLRQAAFNQSKIDFIKKKKHLFKESFKNS